MLNKILETIAYAIGGALVIITMIFGWKTIMQLTNIYESK